MKERVLSIGKNPALVGILTDSVDVTASQGRPTCILLNAGLVHRVGPNRLHVRLARELARAGFRAVRLDLSNRGDSDVRRDGLSFLESSVVELRAVMDHLAGAGSEQFVLMGICSGAVNALQLAAADERVIGCVAIDAPAYPTAGYYARRYIRRLFSAEAWQNTIRGQNAIGRLLRRRLATRAAEDDEFGNPFGDVHVPDKKTAAEVLRRIIGRGAKLFFVFTGSWSTYLYRSQVADAFPFLRGDAAVRVEYFPRADHTFTRVFHQGVLVETITTWMVREWGDAERASSLGVNTVRKFVEAE